MKTIGVPIDDYKKERFEEEFKKNGFDNYTISPFTNKTLIIKVIVPEDKVEELKTLCKALQDEFHNKYKREN